MSVRSCAEDTLRVPPQGKAVQDISLHVYPRVGLNKLQPPWASAGTHIAPSRTGPSVRFAIARAAEKLTLFTLSTNLGDSPLSFNGHGPPFSERPPALWYQRSGRTLPWRFGCDVGKSRRFPAKAPGPRWALTFPWRSTSRAPIKHMSSPPLSYRS